MQAHTHTHLQKKTQQAKPKCVKLKLHGLLQLLLKHVVGVEQLASTGTACFDPRPRLSTMAAKWTFVVEMKSTWHNTATILSCLWRNTRACTCIYACELVQRL